MNRRDFELVARTIKSIPDASVPVSHRQNTAVRFADAIQKEPSNSGFNRAKFLQQCGVPNDQ